MSPTIRHKYKYFHSTVQRAKDRRQKFHFCRLPFDVRPRNVKLNLSRAFLFSWLDFLPAFYVSFSFILEANIRLITHWYTFIRSSLFSLFRAGPCFCMRGSRLLITK